MEFENKNFGICKLLNCDYEKGICLVEIKDKNKVMPYVITSVIINGNWIKGEYFSTLEEAKKRYAAIIVKKVLGTKDDSQDNE